MLRRVLLVLLGIGLVAFVAFVVFRPAPTGQAVDCGGIDEAMCAVLVSEVVADARAASGPVGLLPVTHVSLSGPESCVNYLVWFAFGFGVSMDGYQSNTTVPLPAGVLRPHC